MRTATLSILLVGFAMQAFAADGLFSGTWKLDASKTKAGAPAPRSETLQLDLKGADLTMSRTGVDSQGNSYDQMISAVLDGGSFAVLHSPELSAVECWRTDARSFRIRFKRAAGVIEWAVAEASKDGKSLKWTSTVTAADGKETKFITAYTRQGTAEEAANALAARSTGANTPAPTSSQSMAAAQQ